jgi:hypothetical protein
MTQFMLVESDVRLRLPPGTRADRVGRFGNRAEEFLAEVAEYQFGTSTGYSVVTSDGRSIEPLIDDVWEALENGSEIEATDFGRFAAMLIRDGIGFACWAADDYRDLPIVCSWDELATQLRGQTRNQPAELYVRFSPEKSIGCERPPRTHGNSTT